MSHFRRLGRVRSSHFLIFKKGTKVLSIPHFNGGDVKQQTPGSSITRRGNNRILVLVKVVTLKWLWRPLPAGLARAQLHGGQFQVVPSASATLDRPSFEFYASAALRVRRYHQSDFESGRFSPGSLSPSSCPRLPSRSGGAQMYEKSHNQLIFYAQTPRMSQTIDRDE